MEKDTDYNSALSKNELHQIVCRQFQSEDVVLQNYQLSAFSDEPMGFLGVHFKIVGEAKVRGQIEPFRFFAKKIPEDVPLRFNYATDVGAFFKEVQFYETLVEDIKQNLTGKHKKWCPNFLFSRGDNIMVCEDLTLQKYYIYPERQMMELDHVLATVKTLAAMHAAPLILMGKLEAGTAPHPPPNWSTKHPAQLALLYNHIIYETEVSDIPGHFGNILYRAGISSQLPVVDLLPGYTPEQKDNIKKHLPDILNRTFELVKPSTKFRNTFAHGDLWSNNVMFSDDETGKVKDAIIIDFQLARFAPPSHDLVFFLHLVQNRAFRQAHEQRILDHYYESFTEEVAAEGLEVEKIFPKEELIESYKHCYEFAILMKMLFFQFALTPPGIIGKYMESPEMFEHIFLTDRSEMVLETFRTDETSRERITECMQEVIAFHKLDDLAVWKDIEPKLKF